MVDFSVRMIVKFNGWSRKTIGYLFYTISSVVHYFKAVSKFKLELHYGNAQLGWKSAILRPVWTCNLTDDIERQEGISSVLLQALCIISWPSVNTTWSYNPETPSSVQNRLFFVPCDVEIWQMTFNKANLRDLIAATGLVILLKLDSNHRFFSPMSLWNLMDDLEK